jgi:hypothetical protein
VQEAILAEEQARGLHPPDGRDLSVELEETRTRGWNQWQTCRQGWATIVAGRGNFPRPSRPRHATRP